MIRYALLLGLAGCTTPTIVASQNACTQLVPAGWKAGVAGADLPDTSGDTLAQLKAWIGFGVDQTNRLDQANGRTADALGIIERCEARDAQAVAKARPGFLGF